MDQATKLEFVVEMLQLRRLLDKTVAAQRHRATAKRLKRQGFLLVIDAEQVFCATSGRSRLSSTVVSVLSVCRIYRDPHKKEMCLFVGLIFFSFVYIVFDFFIVAELVMSSFQNLGMFILEDR